MSDISLTYDTLTDHHYDQINTMLRDEDTHNVLRWTFEQVDSDKIVYACSFGAEGMVLIDHLSRICPYAQIVFLDTDFHLKDTYRLIEQVKEKYPDLNIQILKPKWSPSEQEHYFGEKLWEHHAQLCCQMRKVEPLKQALQNVDVWISGLRRAQSPSREHVQHVNRDDIFGKVKICPLIHWSWEDIWQEIHERSLPYHRLHDKGYPSIGCEQCTKPVHSEQEMRAGRWAGQAKTECGLHGSK